MPRRPRHRFGRSRVLLGPEFELGTGRRAAVAPGGPRGGLRRTNSTFSCGRSEAAFAKLRSSARWLTIIHLVGLSSRIPRQFARISRRDTATAVPATRNPTGIARTVDLRCRVTLHARSVSCSVSSRLRTPRGCVRGFIAPTASSPAHTSPPRASRSAPPEVRPAPQPRRLPEPPVQGGVTLSTHTPVLPSNPSTTTNTSCPAPMLIAISDCNPPASSLQYSSLSQSA